MKKLYIFILFFFISAELFAQVRSKICIVRPNYTEEVIQAIYDFEPLLKGLGINNPDRYIKNFLKKGISGSGFVFVDSNGKNYIITNRHVIRDAASADVVFQDADTGEERIYKNLQIFAADAELDLALLTFQEDEQPFTTGVVFYKGSIEDGDPVYTAGYPGFMGKLEWQFGQGFIKNKKIFIDELIKSNLSYLIQHSAWMTGGNSGGPLLIKTNEDYEVVGVNTWGTRNRYDINFSIPVTTLENFINDALNGNNKGLNDLETILVEKSTKLQKRLNKSDLTYEDLINYISFDYVANDGQRILKIARGQCSGEDRNLMYDILKEYSPIECMRYAIGWYLFFEYHKYEQIKNNYDETFDDENKLPEILPPKKLEDSELWYTKIPNNSTRRVGRIEWTYTNGGWEIYSFKNVDSSKSDINKTISHTKKIVPTIPEEKATKVGDTLVYNPFHVQIGYGKMLGISDLDMDTTNQDIYNLYTHIADINFKITNTVSLDVTVKATERKIKIINQGEVLFPFKSISPYAGIQLQLPYVNANSIRMPYIGIQGGIDYSHFDDNKIKPVANAKLGYRAIKTTSNYKFGGFIDIGGSCKIRFVDSFGISHISFLNLILGIAF